MEFLNQVAPALLDMLTGEGASQYLSYMLAGMSGGTVTLIQTARRMQTLPSVRHIAGSLFISAFTAWLWSTLISQVITVEAVRMASSALAGMSADKLLLLLERWFMTRVREAVKK